MVTFHGRQQWYLDSGCVMVGTPRPHVVQGQLYTLVGSSPHLCQTEIHGNPSFSYEVAAEPGGCDSDFPDSTVGRALELERPGSHPGSNTYPSGT